MLCHSPSCLVCKTQDKTGQQLSPRQSFSPWATKFLSGVNSWHSPGNQCLWPHRFFHLQNTEPLQFNSTHGFCKKQSEPWTSWGARAKVLVRLLLNKDFGILGAVLLWTGKDLLQNGCILAGSPNRASDPNTPEL